MTKNNFAGKRVLVTGGVRGTGKIIAREFAARGAELILNYFHSHDDAKRTAEEFHAMGSKVHLIRASVARREQVDQMFDEIEAQFGRLDILINNAADGALARNDELNEKHLDRAMNTNFRGALWCARRAAPLMPAGGAIVNMSSMGGGWVVANYLAVGTSKAALEALTRYHAVEFAPRGVRVNAISATLIEGAVADLFPDPSSTKRSSIAATPLKRLATAEDLAGIALFLASDASSWITGQVIVADGGLTLASEALAPRDVPDSALRHPSVSNFTPVQAKSSQATASKPAPVAIAENSMAPGHAPEEPTAAQGLADDDIVVVGMGLALPGANTPDEFWELLDAPRELFGGVPKDRWDYKNFYDPDPSVPDKSYQSNSVFITDFKPHPRLAEEIAAGTAPEEMTTRWLRHALMQALDGTRLQENDRLSFLVGYTADGSQHFEEAMVLAGLEGRGAGKGEQAVHSRLMTAARARYDRGAKGFEEFLPHRVGLGAMAGLLPDDCDVMMVDTACSSSLYSIDLGMRALREELTDVAVCGGAFGLGPRGKVLFSKLSGLSKGGRVRSLDKSADGVLFADGAGVVILKTWARARADGDEVLGVLEAFGSSSDGKGKAIYAPSSKGQTIAIRRAFPEGSNLSPNAIDWVIAHATGTPAGDLAEFNSLRAMFAGDKEVQLTSNKSLIGHTGWTAGVASVIQALLSLRHGRISKQYRFDAPPAEFRLDTSKLRIPKDHVAWTTSPGRRRRAAVSGFGFGGTNGHLVVGEPTAAPDAARPLERKKNNSPLAIVGWSAAFPGLSNREQIEDWLAGRGPGPARTYGAAYPMPPFERVKMPPAVLRILDRCQLMALDAAHELRARIQPLWEKESDTISVVMGHMGATANAALYASRCYMDDVANSLGDDDEDARALLALIRTEVDGAIATTSENSFPGMMPNVIPARVANYYDLHGPNMTIDMGRASALAALRAAERYLRAGDVRLAIVGGVNGNATPECGPASAEPAAEGIVLFAVMMLDQAQAEGLPVLATLEAGGAPQAAHNTLSLADGTQATWLGADGALDLLRAIVKGEETTLARPAHARDHARFAMRVRPGAPKPSVSNSEAETAVHNANAQNLNVRGQAPAAASDGLPLQLKRYAIEWREQPAPDDVATPFLPEGVVIVTDDPELVAALGPLPQDARVLSLAPLSAPRAGWAHVPKAIEGAIDDFMPDDTRHLRVVSSGRLTRGGAAAIAEVCQDALELHDLLFLAVKRAYAALGNGGDVVVLFIDAVQKDRQHPVSGLFSGFIKSLSLELLNCRARLLCVSETDVASAVRKAEREGAMESELPVAFYDGRTRYALGAHADAGDCAANAQLPLDRESVIVAVGGARGITAETLKGLLPLTKSKVWLIGTSPLNEDPGLLDLDDEAFAKTRPAFMRDVLSKERGLGPVVAARRFDRLTADRAVRRTMETLKAVCGDDRVRYLAADALDRAALDRAAQRILAEDGRADFVINAAGIGRSGAISTKSLAEFQSIRDVKTRGYLNMRAAFAPLAPKMWCNFGSLIGLTGQSGEADYSSGNDFLNANAFWNSAHGANEFTIGWTLWGDAGMASNVLLRAFYERSDFYTTTRPAEGVWHFLRELRMSDRGAASVQLGDNERNTIAAAIPGFLEKSRARAMGSPAEAKPDSQSRSAPAKAEPPVSQEKAAPHAAQRDIPRRGGFYLGRELARDNNSVMFERVFDLDADAYLQHHIVNGFATLPGTFVTEIAAEAALQLVDGVVTGFEDAVFHHFLRVYDRVRPMAKKISVRLIDREGGQARVQVLITGDVVSPAGVVLQKDKLHFEIKTIVADSYEAAPSWTPWPMRPCTAVPDPYHFEKAPVLLTGPFVSTTATCVTPLGKRARYDLKVAQDDPVFSRFVIPTILLDGLARVGVLHLTDGVWIPLAAPASIRRIDLWTPGNDIELARAAGPIDLYVTPSGFELATPGKTNRFVAVGPDGRMIAQMRDLVGVVTGYVHKDTGEFMSGAAVEALVHSRRIRALEGSLA